MITKRRMNEVETITASVDVKDLSRGLVTLLDGISGGNVGDLITIRFCKDGTMEAYSKLSHECLSYTSIIDPITAAQKSDTDIFTSGLEFNWNRIPILYKFALLDVDQADVTCEYVQKREGKRVSKQLVVTVDTRYEQNTYVIELIDPLTIGRMR